MSYAEKYEQQMKEFLQVCRRLSENMYVTPAAVTVKKPSDTNQA